MHRLEYKVWQGGSGKWYTNDTTELGVGLAGYWATPARMLQMDLPTYVEMLINEFGASEVSYNMDKDFLYYCWKTEAAAKKFIKFINDESKRTNFII